LPCQCETNFATALRLLSFRTACIRWPSPSVAVASKRWGRRFWPSDGGDAAVEGPAAAGEAGAWALDAWTLAQLAARSAARSARLAARPATSAACSAQSARPHKPDMSDSELSRRGARVTAQRTSSGRDLVSGRAVLVAPVLRRAVTGCRWRPDGHLATWRRLEHRLLATAAHLRGSLL